MRGAGGGKECSARSDNKSGWCEISDKKEGIYREGYLMRLEPSTRALSFPKDAATTSSLMVNAKSWWTAYINQIFRVSRRKKDKGQLKIN